ncbi:hypothetical protein L3Y34_012902 [Caenorhabditis briggsae]|uniref:Uncharacterized protein n=1 Tax=Caenorhabditis briggsae TaxID=6238 RepID=A0AAE9CWF1_CAEBR|nr:hypothetical protein L3Y34_012902 [Caenorhabditis briggsae]
MFEGQNPEIEFEITNDGTRLENICKITVNAITYKYKIKANHGAGGNNKASRWDLDIIELYCFKLLESIGISINSTEQIDTTEATHAVVHVHFLAVMLSLDDIHEEIFGFNANSDPIIMDFMMSNYRDLQNIFLY